MVFGPSKLSFPKTNIFIAAASVMWRIAQRLSHSTNATDKLKAYLDDLKNERRTSKLHIASVFKSKDIMQLLDNFKQSDLRTRGRIRTQRVNANYLSYMNCNLYLNAKIHMLRGFFSKLIYHFQINTRFREIGYGRLFQVKEWQLKSCEDRSRRIC